MKIVIDIPEEAYKALVINQYYGSKSNLENIILNGKPLPKGHGRLMIISEDILKENQINLDFSCPKWISEVGLSNATVAIIKTKGSESE